MAASKRSELSVDVEGKRSTKGVGKEKRVPDLDNDFIITTRVEKGLKRWKVLQTKIPKKQRRVAKGGRSKNLEPYTIELNKLVEQMKKDIPELESIFFDEYSNAFDRKDKRRTTTGGMRNENRETLGLRSVDSDINQLKSQLEKERTSKDEALSSLRSAESGINQLKSQLEKERKSKEETLSSLRSAESEINQLKSQLEKERMSKEETLFSLRSATSEINQLTSQLENERTSKQEALSLRSAESETNQLKSQLEKERKSREETLSSLRSAESEINQLKSQLEKERKSREETLSSLRSATSEINQLTSQLENERTSKQEALRLSRRLDESENEKVALKLSHKEEIGVHKEEIRKLQERLTIDKSYEARAKELKRKCDELETELASLENEKRRTVEELKRVEAKNNQFTNQLENERKAKEDTLFSLRSAESEISQLKRQLENERKSKEDTLRLEARNNQLTTQLENERKAKEDALLRLSSMASNKLRDNNPNIADLSDPNRPTKISEQFSELYDNEWTDAFDELEKMLRDKEEKEIISYLRDFVLEIYSVCSDLSFSKMKTIEEAFVKPSAPSVNIKIPTEILKTIKDGIKSMAPKLLEDTRGLVLGRLEEKYLKDPVASCLQHKNVKRYIDKCTEVCWYMSVQDPPLVMDGSKSSDDKFDSNKHREYTKKGPYEEFVVWPVLYLYRGGQMLSKGVAQGAKKEMIGQQ